MFKQLFVRLLIIRINVGMHVQGLMCRRLQASFRDKTAPQWTTGKKVDNTRKKTWREEEVVRAEVIGYRGIDWYRLDGNSTSTNHRIYGKPTAPLKAFGRLQLRNVRLAPTTNAMMAYTDCRRTQVSYLPPLEPGMAATKCLPTKNCRRLRIDVSPTLQTVSP